MEALIIMAFIVNPLIGFIGCRVLGRIPDADYGILGNLGQALSNEEQRELHQVRQTQSCQSGSNANAEEIYRSKQTI
jgi:hypothetical protein